MNGKRSKQKTCKALLRRSNFSLILSGVLIFLLVDIPNFNHFPVEAANDDYYIDDDAADDIVNDDAGGAGDDAVGNDDATGDDVVADDKENVDEVDGDNEDENVENDDDLFQWNENGYGALSVMPVSCINYNNGHMVKFDFFESNENGNYQCRFNHLGSFVVSIAHFMRAYFNNEALLKGGDFSLPSDAVYLNCVMIQDTTNQDLQLYAKIGCMDRETYTSTKLQLHVYEDAQCSVPYDDGATSKRHSARGYEINGFYFSSRVSFRASFHTCQSCSPEQISDTFNKRNWYDDDYISTYGSKVNDADDSYKDDDENNSAYMYANDDVGRDDDARYYANNDDSDDGNRLLLESEDIRFRVSGDLVKKYHTEFWSEVNKQRRELYENMYDIGEWNMCQRIKKYGVWCDSECQALDTFRMGEWSSSDVVLLALMCVFVAAMMLLVVAKRLKASQKARVYGDENYKPGLPPLAMAMIFLLIIAIISILANLKFVNETLVFAVVICILFFIYMLKLTLFESRRPVLLAAPQHHMFDNPLDDHLFS